ncbi:hypothetical protein [Pantoea agglomerans]|uniref:hypothetical protein n=1 Tax=Enterobacter agglomerans TaxID=549 RepID=UPI003C7E42DD
MAFSSNIKTTGFQLSSTEPMYTNRSWNGALITRSTNIQYYQIQFTLNFNQKDHGEIKQFLAQYSQGRPFTMDLGYLSRYTGIQVATLSTTTTSAAGTYQVTTQANNLEVGTLIQFSNHTKIYRVIANSGTVLSVFPNLRAQVNTGENIKYNNIQGSFVLDADNDYQMQVQNVMSIQLKATEAI